MKTPYIAEMPATPISRSYKALVVDVGLTRQPVVSYNGRLGYIATSGRARQKKGWGYYNFVVLHYLDDNSSEAIPAGKFNRAAKAPAIPT